MEEEKLTNEQTFTRELASLLKTCEEIEKTAGYIRYDSKYNPDLQRCSPVVRNMMAYKKYFETINYNKRVDKQLDERDSVALRRNMDYFVLLFNHYNKQILGDEYRTGEWLTIYDVILDVKNGMIVTEENKKKIPKPQLFLHFSKIFRTAKTLSNRMLHLDFLSFLYGTLQCVASDEHKPALAAMKVDIEERIANGGTGPDMGGGGGGDFINRIKDMLGGRGFNKLVQDKDLVNSLTSLKNFVKSDGTVNIKEFFEQSAKNQKLLKFFESMGVPLGGFDIGDLSKMFSGEEKPKDKK